MPTSLCFHPPWVRLGRWMIAVLRAALLEAAILGSTSSGMCWQMPSRFNLCARNALGRISGKVNCGGLHIWKVWACGKGYVLNLGLTWVMHINRDAERIAWMHCKTLWVSAKCISRQETLRHFWKAGNAHTCPHLHALPCASGAPLRPCEWLFHPDLVNPRRASFSPAKKTSWINIWAGGASALSPEAGGPFLARVGQD